MTLPPSVEMAAGDSSFYFALLKDGTVIAQFDFMENRVITIAHLRCIKEMS